MDLPICPLAPDAPDSAWGGGMWTLRPRERTVISGLWDAGRRKGRRTQGRGPRCCPCWGRTTAVWPAGRLAGGSRVLVGAVPWPRKCRRPRPRAGRTCGAQEWADECPGAPPPVGCSQGTHAAQRRPTGVSGPLSPPGLEVSPPGFGPCVLHSRSGAASWDPHTLPGLVIPRLCETQTEAPAGRVPARAVAPGRGAHPALQGSGCRREEGPRGPGPSPVSASPAQPRPRARAGAGQTDLSGVSGLRKEAHSSPREGFSAHFTDKINQIETARAAAGRGKPGQQGPNGRPPRPSPSARLAREQQAHRWAGEAAAAGFRATGLGSPGLCR